MSRSRKSHPVIKHGDKFHKRCANKLIRKTPMIVDIPNHMKYRKLYETWNIYESTSLFDGFVYSDDPYEQESYRRKYFQK